MCLLWLEFLSLFGGNSIVCRAIPCWFRCNSLFVVICYSLVLLLFLHCEASSSWCCNSSLFLSFWCTPYLFCRFLYFVSCYCNSFIVHLFSTKCQICLAQNAKLVLGLLQISAPVLLGCHSCLFLMRPYKTALLTLEVFSRALQEHIATNKFQLGFAIPVCFLFSLQMLPLALKLVSSLCTATVYHKNKSPPISTFTSKFHIS